MRRAAVTGPPAALMLTREVSTPLGVVIGCASPRGVRLLEFADRRAPRSNPDEPTQRDAAAEGEGERAAAAAHLDELARQLDAYFAGTLREFTVALDAPGSAFERRAWDLLRTIPFGQTRSYGWMAARLGDAGAARAAGRANGRNRVAIVIPCHRVIAADGTLQGYGGGLRRKQWLLDHERGVVGAQRLFD